MPVIVGADISSFCPKCKRDSEHIVIDSAEKGRRVGRVRCSSCGEEHPFRKPKSTGGRTPKKAAKSAGSPRQRRVKTPEETATDEWAEVHAMVEAAQKVPYAMNGAYDRGQVIDHLTLGPGVVLAVLGPQKVEVLFKVGRRRLVCARA